MNAIQALSECSKLSPDCEKIAQYCKGNALNIDQCAQYAQVALLSQTNIKLDLLATGGLIALALALNLAYLNLPALRFPEKLRRFVDDELRSEVARERLASLLGSKSKRDRTIGGFILRTATETDELTELNPDNSLGFDSRHISESLSTQLFHKFAFDSANELSPVPTLDKVVCAIFGIISVAFLFRDTASMMMIAVPNWLWLLLISVPVIVLTAPMWKHSKLTVFTILFTLILFGVHLLWFSQTTPYVEWKNHIDFGLLTAGILAPTLIVTWSNSAYPEIEKKISDALADQDLSSESGTK